MQDKEQNKVGAACSDHTANHSSDNRPRGHYCSRYGLSAWAQILAELFFLLLYLSCSIWGVFKSIQLSEAGNNTIQIVGTLDHSINSVLPWSGMLFAALAGGTTFALKWLYHTVAKAEWNRDRILWRVIAPLNSAVLATSAGFGITAGIMPFVDQNSLSNIYTAMFFGFFIGHFSDNVLAALQRLAKNWFGTVDR